MQTLKIELETILFLSDINFKQFRSTSYDFTSKYQWTVQLQQWAAGNVYILVLSKAKR